jgi:hypothetical protein
MRLSFAHPIIVALAVVGAGCGPKGDVNQARRSFYDTDFAVVYNATLAVMRDQYPDLQDFPSQGRISTAWKQVQYSNTGFEDPKSIQAQDRALGLNPDSNGGNRMTAPSSIAYKRYFVRFDVTVAGGRPWRIKVVGHAQEWEPGNAQPVDLKGAAAPHWLAGRTDSLVLAIHNKLKQYAIVREEEAPPPVDAPPAIDDTAFGPIAPAAGHRIGELREAITRRDIVALRATLADDVMWDLGASPGIDGALAMWQADPAILDALAAAIDAGCRGNDNEVLCPPAATETPGFTGWRLTLTRRDGGWWVTAFVRGD